MTHNRFLRIFRGCSLLSGKYLAIAGLALLGLGCSPENIEAQREEKRNVNVIVFPGAFNWPIWAAQENKFFDREGINVELAYTTSSVQQISSLMAGEQDIVMTAIDNVVAYDVGAGDVKFDAQPDLFAFMGGDNGFLSLIVQSGVNDFEDLRGKQLAVDALTTGYAFVLRKLLQQGDISEQDVEFVSAGGALQRYQALSKGDYAGTILMTPFDIMARSAGLHELAKASNVIGPYQGVVGAARRSWAKNHRNELVNYIRAYRAALDWLYDPGNKQAALAILQKNIPNMSETLGESIYGILLAEKDGLERNAKLDLQGVAAVLELREEFGTQSTSLGRPMDYYNPEYFKEAASSE